MTSLFPFLPPGARREWICGRYRCPVPVRERGEIIQPDVVMWMELPSGMLLATTLIDPREPLSLAATFEQATLSLDAGSPRPTSIRVANDAMAKELRRVAGGIPIVAAPIPELDAAFAELTEATIAATEPSYFDGGDIPEDVVADFFAAARLLFEAAPWRVIAEDQVIGVDISALKIKRACLSVIGGHEQSFGLLLFRSLEHYLAFGTRAASGGRTKDPVTVRSMSFGKRKEIPPSMLREIKTHRWPVAGVKAYPSLFCLDRSMQPVPVTERDFRIMTACSSAFLAFFANHHDIFEQERPAIIKPEYIDENGLKVTFTVPF